jgi:hypothetical protein
VMRPGGVGPVAERFYLSIVFRCAAPGRRPQMAKATLAR